MPYPTEHAARIRDPGAFDPDSFRSKDLKGGVRIILGKLKGQDSMTVQAYRFSIDQFTSEEAKKWLEDNKVSYLKFEPAKEETVSHTGVLGMKWGVRHNPKSKGIPSGTIARKVGPNHFKILYKPKPGDSEHHGLFSAIRKKKVQDMTDDELKFVTKRVALISLYKKSGAITKKKIREMSNDDLQGHVSKYQLRKGILKNPVRRWKLKDFIKTYKLNDTDTKTLLDRVNKENEYYTAKDADIKAVAKYVKTFLDTNP